jgi:hypothetical protein
MLIFKVELKSESTTHAMFSMPKLLTCDLVVEANQS